MHHHDGRRTLLHGRPVAAVDVVPRPIGRTRAERTAVVCRARKVRLRLNVSRLLFAGRPAARVPRKQSSPVAAAKRVEDFLRIAAGEIAKQAPPNVIRTRRALRAFPRVKRRIIRRKLDRPPLGEYRHANVNHRRLQSLKRGQRLAAGRDTQLQRRSGRRRASR